MKRRSDLNRSGIDRDFPFQVAVKWIPGQNVGHLHRSSAFSSLCWRRHHVNDGQDTYEVLCFRNQAQAAAFREAIMGEYFDPRDRVGWRWDRGRGARRDEKRRQRGY